MKKLAFNELQENFDLIDAEDQRRIKGGRSDLMLDEAPYAPIEGSGGGLSVRDFVDSIFARQDGQWDLFNNARNGDIDALTQYASQNGAINYIWNPIAGDRLGDQAAWEQMGGDASQVRVGVYYQFYSGGWVPSRDSLDPSTIGQNLFGLSYPGGNNPMSYNGRDNFSYVPENLSEYPAIGHDRRFGNLGAEGIVSLLTELRTIGADWKFVSEELGIAITPFLNPTDRLSAGALGVGLGILALPKTIIGLFDPNGYSQAVMWYEISNIGVTNAPSEH